MGVESVQPLLTLLSFGCIILCHPVPACDILRVLWHFPEFCGITQQFKPSCPKAAAPLALPPCCSVLSEYKVLRHHCQAMSSCFQYGTPLPRQVLMHLWCLQPAQGSPVLLHDKIFFITKFLKIHYTQL